MINGHVYPEADQTPEIRYRQPRLLYWHVGNGRFRDLSAQAGAGITAALLVARLRDRRPRRRRVARGRRQQHGRASKPAEEHGPRQHWLLVRLVGVTANRDAIGARIVVHAAGRRVSGEVQSGSSYISQNDARLHVGLSTNESYERIEVIWPGGMRELFPAGKADRAVTLTQGTGSRPPSGSTKIGPAPARPESRR